MTRSQLKRWQIFRLHKGVTVQVGRVAAVNQPQAIQKASRVWSVYADKTKPGYGFTARLAP
jgi:hypothetical protein